MGHSGDDAVLKILHKMKTHSSAVNFGIGLIQNSL